MNDCKGCIALAKQVEEMNRLRFDLQAAEVALTEYRERCDLLARQRQEFVDLLNKQQVVKKE